MNCNKIKKLLGDYLEGLLSDPLKQKVDEHLRGCAVCQREKELLVQSWQMLDAYTAPKLNENFTSSLMRKIRSAQTEPAKFKYALPQFGFRPLAPALASLFVVILTVSLFLNRTIISDKIAKISPKSTEQTETTLTDAEIIANLDLLADIDLLESLDLITDLDVIGNN